MIQYHLTPSAKRDLVEIRDYYLEVAGVRVARRMVGELFEAFRFLVKFPDAGHRREDLAEERPIRFWTVRDYLILYQPATDPLLILMIVRGSRDVPALLSRRRL